MAWRHARRFPRHHRRHPPNVHKRTRTNEGENTINTFVSIPREIIRIETCVESAKIKIVSAGFEPAAPLLRFSTLGRQLSRRRRQQPNELIEIVSKHRRDRAGITVHQCQRLHTES